MDMNAFDDLARTISGRAVASRRGLLGALVVALLGRPLAAPGPAASAAPRKKKRCKKFGAFCGFDDGKCCTRNCCDQVCVNATDVCCTTIGGTITCREGDICCDPQASTDAGCAPPGFPVCCASSGFAHPVGTTCCASAGEGNGGACESPLFSHCCPASVGAGCCQSGFPVCCRNQQENYCCPTGTFCCNSPSGCCTFGAASAAANGAGEQRGHGKQVKAGTWVAPRRAGTRSGHAYQPVAGR